MADIAGLVVGGVAIASLFTTCIDCFEYVQLGKGFGKEYQKYMLKLSIVQLRLSRWGESVRITAKTRESSGQAETLWENEGRTVKILLAAIMESFDEARKFTSGRSTSGLGLDVEQNDCILAIVEKMRTLALRRQKNASFGKKMAWALFDEKQLNKVIGEVTVLVNDLVDLFPAAKETQYRLCSDELSEIVDVSSEDQDLAILRTASSGIDETLERVVGVVAEAAEARRSHSFANISAVGRARMMNGDHVNEGEYTTPSYGHSYRDISAADNARILNGNTFGGKSIWDD